MPGLSDLQAAVADLKNKAGSGRVYFYATGDHSGQLKHGFISVEGGRTCHVEYGKKTLDEALADIVRMSFLKIVFMPVEAIASGPPSGQPIAIDDLLKRLVPAVTVEPVSASIVGTQRDMSAARNDTGSQDEQALIELRLMSLQRDVTDILQNFYGSAAGKKVADVAAQFPPHQKPIHFLNHCKQLAAMMVGADKANQLFGPLYDKTST